MFSVAGTMIQTSNPCTTVEILVDKTCRLYYFNATHLTIKRVVKTWIKGVNLK